MHHYRIVALLDVVELIAMEVAYMVDYLVELDIGLVEVTVDRLGQDSAEDLPSQSVLPKEVIEHNEHHFERCIFRCR